MFTVKPESIGRSKKRRSLGDLLVLAQTLLQDYYFRCFRCSITCASCCLSHRMIQAQNNDLKLFLLRLL